MPEFTIRVEGMEELRKGLRNIDKQLGKELGQVNKMIGAKVVAWSELERSKLAGQFGSYRAKVVKVSASANQRRALVQIRPGAAEFGTTRHPVFGRWMDQASFSRRVWPSPNRAGWLVGSTLKGRDQEITDSYLDAVAALAHRVIGQ